MANADEDRDDATDITGDSRIERIEKGLPDADDVYIDPELTNVAEVYVQNDEHFIARKMMTAVPVQKRTGQFASFSKADYQRDEMQERGDGSHSAEGGFRQSFKSYACTVYGLHDDVGPQRRANSPNTGTATARYLMRKGLIKTERLFASLAWQNDVWSTQLSGINTVVDPDTTFLTWLDDAAFPVETLEHAIELYEEVSAGFPITDLAFSRNVWRVFKNHPNVIARFNGGQTSGGAKVTIQALQDLLEIPRIHVAKAVYTTSAKGVAEASSTFDRICGTGVLGVHKSMTPSTEEPTALSIFDWTGYAGAGAQGQAMFEEPVPNTRGAIRHEIELAVGLKQVSADLGFWLKTPLATPA